VEELRRSSHVGDSVSEELGSGSELSLCGCAETNARHVDGGVDGGGDGCELTRWGRVGVGAGKGRGVAAAKSVKEPFVVVDGDVTGSHGWGQWPEK